MVFEKMKEYFKKKQEKKEKFFLVESKDNDTNYIIEQKMLEVIFVGNWSIKELIKCSFTESVDCHVGNDNKFYEKLRLNETGKWLYNHYEAKAYAPAYFFALQEMREGSHPKHLKREKARLTENFEKNNIKTIKTYTGKELAQNEPKQEQTEAKSKTETDDNVYGR